jgi:hypothetical protein
MAQNAGAAQQLTGNPEDDGGGRNRPLSALVEVTPKEAFKVMLIDCLAKLHSGGREPHWDERIEQAWQEETGTSFLPLRTVPSAALWGPPGHGKSTISKLVGRTVAEHLGLQFVLNPPSDFVVTGKHFLVTTQEMSGSISNVDFAGIPAKATGRRPDGTTYEYMEKLLERRIVQLRDAGAGILLLDDFANASQSVQNNLLSIVEEGRFQGLDLGPRVMPILTANLGSVDGTHTGRPSTATMTRVRNLFVYEDVDEFALRTQLAFRDLPYRDLGISEYLKRNSVYYDTLDPTGPVAPHACPRSLTKVIDSMRLVRHLYEQAEGQGVPRNLKIGVPVRRMLEIYAQGLVGVKAGAALVGYAYSLLTEAEPLAAEAMSHEGLSRHGMERLKALMGNGQSAEAQTFAYQFASAVADRAAELIAGSPRESQTRYLGAERFAQAVLAPDFILDTTRTLALSRLAGRLIELSPQFADPKDKEALRSEVTECLIGALTVVPLDEYFLRQVIPDVLSGHVATTSYATGQRARESIMDQRMNLS